MRRKNVTYIIGSAMILILSAMMRSMIKNNRRKRKQQGIAASIDRFVRQSRLVIKYAEILNYRYIGLDKKNRKLLLIDHSNKEKQEMCIPLLEVAECKIIHLKDKSQSIKTILLELINKRTNKSIRFCFFDQQLDPISDLPGLFTKAINWKTRVDIYKHCGNVDIEAEYIL